MATPIVEDSDETQMLAGLQPHHPPSRWHCRLSPGPFSDYKSLYQPDTTTFCTWLIWFNGGKRRSVPGYSWIALPCSLAALLMFAVLVGLSLSLCMCMCPTSRYQLWPASVWDVVSVIPGRHSPLHPPSSSSLLLPGPPDWPHECVSSGPVPSPTQPLSPTVCSRCAYPL